MTGLVRKATLLGVCGLLAAATAMANVPDPAKSTAPDSIVVVGTLGGNADGAHVVKITVRDFTNAPLPNCLVKINFSGCCDINLCTAALAGTGTKDCPTGTVTGLTNGLGQLNITVVGAGKNNAPPTPPAIFPGCGSGGVKIYANAGAGDVLIKSSTGILLDHNGAAGANDGCNGADLGVIKADVGSIGLGASYKGRSDRNFDGNVNGADIGFLKDDVGRYGLGGGGGCPGGIFCAKAPC